jgi:hypothetical protein
MIVTFEELRKISRKKSRLAVRSWLSRNKITHGMGADGAPWTTTEAINRALLGPELQPDFTACQSRQGSQKSTGATTLSDKTGGTRLRASMRAKLRSLRSTTS